MARCARGTCSRGAVAGLGYDPVGRSVWLIDLPGDEQQVLALCGAHADNLTVPHGWTSQDDRTGSPRLWSLSPASTSRPADPDRLPVRPPARLDHVRARRQVLAEPLELFGFDNSPVNGVSDDGVPDDSVPDDSVPDDSVPDDGVPDEIFLGGISNLDHEIGARSTLIPGADSGSTSDELHVDEGTPLLARAFRATRNAG